MSVSDTNFPNSEKYQLFESWFSGEYILVHIDSRVDGVDVPMQHQGNAALTLKLSQYFQGGTTYDEREIVTHLRFSGTYYACILPWDSVWGLTSSSGENRLWKEDLPREVYLQMARSKLLEIGNKLLGRAKEKEDHNTSSQGTNYRRERPELKALTPISEAPSSETSSSANPSSDSGTDITTSKPPHQGPEKPSRNPALKRIK